MPRSYAGPHPETGEPLTVEDGPPEGAPAMDLPPQPAVFAPDYARRRSRRSRNACASRPGLPDQPLGDVVVPPPPSGNGLTDKVKDVAEEVTDRLG